MTVCFIKEKKKCKATDISAFTCTQNIAIAISHSFFEQAC